WTRLDPDDSAHYFREGSRCRDGHSARIPLLRHLADRLPDGPFRPGRPRAACRRRLSRRVGQTLPGHLRKESTMPRIAPVTGKSDVSAEYHGVVDDVLKVFGSIRGPFSMLLHSPKLAARLLPLVTFNREDNVVEAKLRSIAILSAVREREAAYVWSAQVGAAR